MNVSRKRFPPLPRCSSGNTPLVRVVFPGTPNPTKRNQPPKTPHHPTTSTTPTQPSANGSAYRVAISLKEMAAASTICGQHDCEAVDK